MLPVLGTDTRSSYRQRWPGDPPFCCRRIWYTLENWLPFLSLHSRCLPDSLNNVIWINKNLNGMSCYGITDWITCHMKQWNYTSCDGITALMTCKHPVTWQNKSLNQTVSNDEPKYYFTWWNDTSTLCVTCHLTVYTILILILSVSEDLNTLRSFSNTQSASSHM